MIPPHPSSDDETGGGCEFHYKSSYESKFHNTDLCTVRTAHVITKIKNVYFLFKAFICLRFGPQMPGEKIAPTIFHNTVKRSTIFFQNIPILLYFLCQFL
jgi:hypothetical protein